MKLSTLPKRIETSLKGSLDRDELNVRGRKLEVFRVLTFRLTSLCYFWQNDSGTVAQSWGSRGTGTEGRHQLCAREANVLS